MALADAGFDAVVLDTHTTRHQPAAGWGSFGGESVVNPRMSLQNNVDDSLAMQNAVFTVQVNS